MGRLEVYKDTNGLLSGNADCKVCNKRFTWTEDNDAYLYVDTASEVRDGMSLDMRAYIKCPQCGFNSDYHARHLIRE